MKYSYNRYNKSHKYIKSYDFLTLIYLWLYILKFIKDIKINSIKKCNGKNIRVISIFKLGFTLFEIAFNSLIYIRIPYKFILYDI